MKANIYFMCDATSLTQTLLLFKHCPEHTEDKLNAVVYMNLKVKTQNFFYCHYIFSLKHVLYIADCYMWYICWKGAMEQDSNDVLLK